MFHGIFGDPPKNQSNSRYFKFHPWIQSTNSQQYKQSVNDIYIRFDICVICSLYLHAIALLLKYVRFDINKQKTLTFEFKHSSSSHTEMTGMHKVNPFNQHRHQINVLLPFVCLCVCVWWWLMTSIPLIENVYSIECELKAFWNTFGGFDLVDAIAPQLLKVLHFNYVKSLDTFMNKRTISVEQNSYGCVGADNVWQFSNSKPKHTLSLIRSKWKN